MKNTTILIGIVVIIVLTAIFVFAKSGSSETIENTGAQQNVQVVKLYVEGGQYVMEPSEFRKGVPVRLEADMSKMPGCSRSIVISAFNVRKNFGADNTVEFTPDKAGTFNIACSMNMYRGTFKVLEDDGSNPVYVEAPVQGGGSCGAGGGCGCGAAI